MNVQLNLVCKFSLSFQTDLDLLDVKALGAGLLKCPMYCIQCTVNNIRINRIKYTLWYSIV